MPHQACLPHLCRGGGGGGALQPWLARHWQPKSVRHHPQSSAFSAQRNACKHERCRLKQQLSRPLASFASAILAYGAENSYGGSGSRAELSRPGMMQATDLGGTSGTNNHSSSADHRVGVFQGLQQYLETTASAESFKDSGEKQTLKIIHEEEVSGSVGESLNKKDGIVEEKGSDESGEASLDGNVTAMVSHGGLNEEIEYYEPKVGDEVLGVVVSCNEKRLDVDIGADMLGFMLAKDVLPSDRSSMEAQPWDIPEVSTEGEEKFIEPIYNVKIVRDQEILTMENPKGRLLDVGTIVSAEVLGRTLSGRPLLSARKVARKIAWERLRQIREEKEPIEVLIREWNADGVSARIEGLRAFLPKEQFVKYPQGGVLELKEQVGKRMFVFVIDTNESTNKLIVSEREAWIWRLLRPGCLFEGTITRLYPFGAVVMVDGTGVSGLLHISNMSKMHVSEVGDVFSVGEKIKAIVIPSPPNKLSFSTAELESEQGLLLEDKKRVFREAEAVAKAIRKSHNLDSRRLTTTVFQDETGAHGQKYGRQVANLEWLEFLRESNEIVTMPLDV